MASGRCCNFNPRQIALAVACRGSTRAIVGNPCAEPAEYESREAFHAKTDEAIWNAKGNDWQDQPVFCKLFLPFVVHMGLDTPYMQDAAARTASQVILR